MSETASVLGEQISTLSRAKTIELLEKFALSGKPHQAVTVNSEFLLAAQKDDSFRAILHNSDLNTADSIGILWAAKFLSLPVFKNKTLRFLQIVWQFKYSLTAIVFAPRWIRSVMQEKNSGTDLVWNIAGIAEKHNLSVFLLGGFGDTPKKVGERLKDKHPNLKIAGVYNGKPEDEGLLDKIKNAHPDILLVAFGPVSQEKWIAQNMQKLPISLAVGLGGTFDYLARKRPLAPSFLRYTGLEWLFRLITQPYRFLRVFQAVMVFPLHVLRYKFQIQKPYRKNVVGCIINSRGQVLICRVHVNSYRMKNKQYFEYWQLPQGGLEAGETAEQAFAREMHEEIGLKEYKILSKTFDVNRYDWPIEYSIESYGGRFRGQEQTVFLAQIDEVVSPIKLDEKEFDSFAWKDENKLVESVHPLYRKIAEFAVNELSKIQKP